MNALELSAQVFKDPSIYPMVLIATKYVDINCKIRIKQHFCIENMQRMEACCQSILLSTHSTYPNIEPRIDQLRDEVPDDVLPQLPIHLRTQAIADKAHNATLRKKFAVKHEAWRAVELAICNGRLAYEMLVQYTHSPEGLVRIQLHSFWMY